MTGPKRIRSLVWATLHLSGVVALVALATVRVQAQQELTAAQVAERGSAAFAANCFSPFMTADRAERVLDQAGVRVDFYDLDPFSSVAPSPVTGRPATAGTDRRCEVAFDGDFAELAASAAVSGLEMEGIRNEAPVPDRYRSTQGTALLGARFLNPRRIAVVHVGTRPGPHGVETFMFVERLMPIAP